MLWPETGTVNPSVLFYPRTVVRHLRTDKFPTGSTLISGVLFLWVTPIDIVNNKSIDTPML